MIRSRAWFFLYRVRVPKTSRALRVQARAKPSANLKRRFSQKLDYISIHGILTFLSEALVHCKYIVFHHLARNLRAVCVFFSTDQVSENQEGIFCLICFLARYDVNCPIGKAFSFKSEIPKQKDFVHSRSLLFTFSVFISKRRH